MFKSIINLLYPPLCQVCGKRAGEWNEALCEDCLKKIRRRTPPFCVKCGKQLPDTPHVQELCRDCEKNDYYFDSVFSIFHYEDVLIDLIHNLKYKKLTSTLRPFAELTADFLKKMPYSEKIDVVTSVPMHPFRLLKREINCPHIIAGKISKILGIRYRGNILKKVKNIPPQSKLKRNERIKNIKGAFRAVESRVKDIRHKNVLLVDDLFTTGSTVNECSRILKEAGAGRVKVITLARGDKIS
jgi:competence protein ComFC